MLSSLLFPVVGRRRDLARRHVKALVLRLGGHGAVLDALAAVDDVVGAPVVVLGVVAVVVAAAAVAWAAGGDGGRTDARRGISRALSFEL